MTPATTPPPPPALPNTIPPITDPLGRHWEQPDPANFLIDDTHAVLTEADFKRLHEYSATLPTGVYPGKCWRRYEKDRGWMLVWYGECDDPTQCNIDFRLLLVVP